MKECKFYFGRYYNKVWHFFLQSQAGKLFRPFVDLKGLMSAQQIGFTTDASVAKSLGFIEDCKPSIEFLELYALVVGVFLWSDKPANQRVVVLCDNISAVHMVNNSSSSCKYCMILIRMLVLRGLIHNTGVFARHIEGRKNILSDNLSRMRLDLFRKNAPVHNENTSRKIPDELWPIQKIWNAY